MLRKVLWIAAVAAAVLVALAVSRSLNFDRRPSKPVAIEQAAPATAPPAVEAAATVAEPPPPVVAKPPPTPEELQVQEDAAATGMTTVEPEEPQKLDLPQPPT